MSETPSGETVPTISLNGFMGARQSVDMANAILCRLMIKDQLYNMPRDESRKLLTHVARLLDIASDELSNKVSQTDFVTP